VLEVIGWGWRRVDFPQEYTYTYNRSKMRHALPWLSLAGGGVLSFEVGCVLKDISWGGVVSISPEIIYIYIYIYIYTGYIKKATPPPGAVISGGRFEF
jgi:hypothetical protein